MELKDVMIMSMIMINERGISTTTSDSCLRSTRHYIVTFGTN